MPRSSAVCTTSVARRSSMRRPKLLQPIPMVETAGSGRAETAVSDAGHGDDLMSPVTLGP
jgi:hypothetical protein